MLEDRTDVRFVPQGRSSRPSTSSGARPNTRAAASLRRRYRPGGPSRRRRRWCPDHRAEEGGRLVARASAASAPRSERQRTRESAASRTHEAPSVASKSTSWRRVVLTSATSASASTRPATSSRRTTARRRATRRPVGPVGPQRFEGARHPESASRSAPRSSAEHSTAEPESSSTPLREGARGPGAGRRARRRCPRRGRARSRSRVCRAARCGSPRARCSPARIDALPPLQREEQPEGRHGDEDGPDQLRAHAGARLRGEPHRATASPARRGRPLPRGRSRRPPRRRRETEPRKQARAASQGDAQAPIMAAEGEGAVTHVERPSRRGQRWRGGRGR